MYLFGLKLAQVRGALEPEVMKRLIEDLRSMPSALSRVLDTVDEPMRAAAEQFARESLRDELTGRPWLALLEPASAAGTRAFDECGALLKEELEVTAKRDAKRTEREGTERAKRAERRARTETLDLGLALVGLWFRDLACLADGAPEVIHHTDRRAQLNEDTRAADPGRLRQAIALVDDTRERLQLNVAEELACEVLAYRLAALLRATARAAA